MVIQFLALDLKTYLSQTNIVKKSSKITMTNIGGGGISRNKGFFFNGEKNYANVQEWVLQRVGKLKGLTREDFAKRTTLQSSALSQSESKRFRSAQIN